MKTTVSIWGVPGSPIHNQSRGNACIAQGDLANRGENCAPGTPREFPFLTLPSGSCSEPLQAGAEAQSWTQGAPFQPSVAPSFTNELAGTETLTNCGELPFTPEISIHPTETEASTPTGLKALVKVPRRRSVKNKKAPEPRPTCATPPSSSRRACS